jgi:hypothetical protein
MCRHPPDMNMQAFQFFTLIEYDTFNATGSRTELCFGALKKMVSLFPGLTADY